MRVDGNFGGTPGHKPNSQGEWQEQPDFAEPPLLLDQAADHWNHREDTDYFSQPGALFRLMSSDQRRALFENTAHAIQGVPQTICMRHIRHCHAADPAYGAGVADALTIPLAEALGTAGP